MLENKKLLDILKTFEKYPLEVIFMKAMILNGVKSEEELVELLNTHKTLAQPTKVNLQNAYRDITRNHLYDFDKIPTMFK
jgi:hypothetical protein